MEDGKATCPFRYVYLSVHDQLMLVVEDGEHASACATFGQLRPLAARSI